MQVFVIPARIVLGAFLVLDNLLPFLLQGESGVAHGAHIGGFLVGAAAAWLMERKAILGRPNEAEIEAHPAGADGVRAALDQDAWRDAARRYFALPPGAARGVLTPDEAVTLARRLRADGNPAAALNLLRRVIRDAPRHPGLGEANALAGAILLEDLGEATAAYQYLLTALDLGVEPATRSEALAHLRAIEALQKRRVGRLRTPLDWS
jgi:hypothetical protein